MRIMSFKKNSFSVQHVILVFALFMSCYLSAVCKFNKYNFFVFVFFILKRFI